MGCRAVKNLIPEFGRKIYLFAEKRYFEAVRHYPEIKYALFLVYYSYNFIDINLPTKVR